MKRGEKKKKQSLYEMGARATKLFARKNNKKTYLDAI